MVLCKGIRLCMVFGLTPVKYEKKNGMVKIM